MFYLALTFGLEDDVPGAVERMVGFVEETGRRHDVEHPIQMTVATSDGERAVGVPLLERGRLAHALLQHARSTSCARCYPDSRARRALGRVARRRSRSRSATCPGVWNAVPESSWGVVQEGEDELHPFTPARPDQPVTETSPASAVERAARVGLRVDLRHVVVEHPRRGEGRAAA